MLLVLDRIGRLDPGNLGTMQAARVYIPMAGRAENGYGCRYCDV